MKKKYKNNIFISHSSANKEVAEQLIAYLERLGIKSKNIFCSSIISQGVKNGEKLGTAISKAINKSRLLIFLISNDFINSTYCMQELGVGWHLSEQEKAKCFCLILPDVNLSEIKGFLNSKIFKFTYIDRQHVNELGLLAENVCAELSLSLPTHTVLNNYETTFFSAVDHMLRELQGKKKLQIEDAQRKERMIAELEEKIAEKETAISKLNKSLQARDDKHKNDLLHCELETIEDRFFYFGFHDGISKEVYSALSKQFWFDMVNRYEELLAILNFPPQSKYMEIALATIYAAENLSEKAYSHMKNYVELEDSSFSHSVFSNFFACYNGSMKEIIDILNGKIGHEKEGLVKDSCIELKHFLEEREKALTEIDNP